MNRALLLLVSIALASCGGKATSTAETSIETATPVTVTSCTVGPMSSSVEVNATSVFLQKSYIKATITGYIKSVNAQLGQRVANNQSLFTIRAKEAESLGATLNALDSTLHFSGLTKILAGSSGYVTQIMHQAGDYVVEGDQLAEISDLNSLVFIMQLPYELNSYLPRNRAVDLVLPDAKVLHGTVSSAMPVVDPVSQTQSIIIKVTTNGTIPENLIAKIVLVKEFKNNTISLPKQAVLTDETQENFWIMKVINHDLAVKIPIVKGIETRDRVEILSPQLSPTDRILLTGNYALADSSKVVIENLTSEVR